MKINFINRLLSSLILLSVAIFITLKGSIIFNFFITIVFIISLFEWHKMSYKKIYYLPGIIYLCIAFYAVFLIRNDFNEYSKFNFMLILSICIFTDIGGYIFGKLLKGPKLTKISPNKTYSGVIGSLLLAYFCGGLLFTSIYNIFYQIPYFTTIELILIALIISITSQIGDLVISFFKRKSGIKDTGQIIPGHGGVLDRIDGMIFAFPICYFFDFV